MTRLERLHAITEEIRRRAPRPVSATWLAEELGVTRRTIERDLAALRSAGLPLFSDPGRRGGQRLHPSAVLPPLNLTDRETTALLVALTIVDGMPYTLAGRSAAAKLGRLLPEVTAVATADLCARIRVQQPRLSGVDGGSCRYSRMRWRPPLSSDWTTGIATGRRRGGTWRRRAS
ncbi:MAG TPA: HTH domain-containing protein [Acidimicrobiales bacterium]|nr:HTH domain-containing protein [Acidimicrobiales bacterium]